ncbi:hypothetical protein ABZ619_35545 [Streptomyces sp. NPDC007851]|uniref:hypothetical protein n=1 Tax=Streptomyces sp. NPDC007851 TaxID=3155008 RepID=UPI0033E13019
MLKGLPPVAGMVSVLAVVGVLGVVGASATHLAPAARTALSADAPDKDPIWDVASSVESDGSGQGDPIWD